MSTVSEIVLPSPTTGTEGWHFFIPSSFARTLERHLRSSPDALITSSVFATGDTFYDCRNGYLPWSDALQHIKRAITVEQDSAGMVSFRVHHVKSGQLQAEDEPRKLATHDFLRFLQTGIDS